MRFPSIEKSKIAFISGSGRSGTTLLTKMLNSHPDILAPSSENSFISIYFHKYKNNTSFTTKEIDDIIRYLWIRKRAVEPIWNIDYDHLKSFLLEHRKTLDFKQLCKILYYHFGNNTEVDDKTYLIDKNPFYIFYLNEFSSYFKDAKFIFIVRDYRARYASLKKVWKIPRLTEGIAWKTHQKKIIELMKRIPEQCLLIRYEDLVSDPESVSKKICSFLHLDFNETMLEHQAHSRIGYEEVVSDDKHRENQLKWHGNSDNPINTKSIDKWKDSLSSYQIKVLEYFNGTIGKKHGYSSTQSISFFHKIYFELRYRPMHLLIFLYPRTKKMVFRLPLSLHSKLMKIGIKLFG